MKFSSSCLNEGVCVEQLMHVPSKIPRGELREETHGGMGEFAEREHRAVLRRAQAIDREDKNSRTRGRDLARWRGV